MTQKRTPDVVITARKSQEWRPWFGDKSHFNRLAELCQKAFESRREIYLAAANSLGDEYDKKRALGLAEEATVKMTIWDGVRRIEGAIEKVIPSIDSDHIKSINITAELPRYPRFGSAKLELDFFPRVGVKADVSSDDEGWAIETFARIAEELKRRRPWWASLPTLAFTMYMGFLATTLIAAFAVMLAVAIEPKWNTRTWWVALAVLVVVQFGASDAVRRLPVFEIHAEGGKPKRLSLLITLAWTIPSSTLLAILVNLLTN